mmetsp:Transcript_12527/g.28265  ORF Transcript_12527/g.28265 Transcript_12527/m.28265 type:complete len:105 (-) Transcript_12527:26-340(-)
MLRFLSSARSKERRRLLTNTLPSGFSGQRKVYTDSRGKQTTWRFLPRPRTMMGVSIIVSLIAMFNAALQRELDKVRMYRGVTLDVERMRKKRPEGLGTQVDETE